MPKALITISDPQDAWLRREAKRLGISISELARRLIDSRRSAESAAEHILNDKERAAMAKAPIYELTWRGKCMFDGCKTLTEMVQRCDSAKEGIQKYIAEGIALEHPVEDDYAFLVTADAKTAKRLKMDKREREDEGEE